jgi:hypothetical protein
MNIGDRVEHVADAAIRNGTANGATSLTSYGTVVALNVPYAVSLIHNAPIAVRVADGGVNYYSADELVVVSRR